MKKWFASSMVVMLAGVILAGCSINIGFPNVEGETTKKAPEIKISVAKNYEDGIELKVALQNVKTVKGNWKVKYCGLEEVRNHADESIIVGFGYSECTPIAENQTPDNTVYASFTGIVDGKQLTVDKVYELTQAEIDQVPPAKEYPTAWTTARNLAKTGNLDDGGSIAFGKNKAEVHRFVGGVDKGNQLDAENEIYSFDTQQKLIAVKFVALKDYPIAEGIDEINADVGNPVTTSKKGDITYYTYKVNQRTIIVAWDNGKEEIKTIEVKDAGVK